MSTLVTFFGAESGRTAKVAKDLAERIGADVVEIVPEKIYSKADLNWMNPIARCNREHALKKDVPVASRVEVFPSMMLFILAFRSGMGVLPMLSIHFAAIYLYPFVRPNMSIKGRTMIPAGNNPITIPIFRVFLGISKITYTRIYK